MNLFFFPIINNKIPTILKANVRIETSDDDTISVSADSCKSFSLSTETVESSSLTRMSFDLTEVKVFVLSISFK